MRGSNAGSKLSSQEIKEGPAKEAWWKEEFKFEIERLKAVLREPTATDEEKAIAQSQIANYREMSVMAARHPTDWLRQMYLLASRRKDGHFQYANSNSNVVPQRSLES